MKLLIVNGASCVGKSTIVKKILRQLPAGYFYLSYDGIKRFFSAYSPQQHLEDVLIVLLAVAEAVFDMKYEVICDVGIFKEFREKLIALAKGKGYAVAEINLEADYEVLMGRFEERIATALANPDRQPSNLSKDRFKELFDIYERGKNPLAITFKTDTLTVEEVEEEILKLLEV